MKNTMKIPFPILKILLSDKEKANLENTIDLPCLECGAIYVHQIDSLTGRGIFNFFCCGDCEDKYARRQ